MIRELITYLSGNIPGGVILLPIAIVVFTIIWGGVWLGTRFWGPNRFFSILVLGYIIIIGSYGVIWKRGYPAPIPIRVLISVVDNNNFQSEWKLRGIIDVIERRLTASPEHFVPQRPNYTTILNKHWLHSESWIDSLAVRLRVKWLITVSPRNTEQRGVGFSVRIKSRTGKHVKVVQELAVSDGHFATEAAQISGAIMRLLGDDSPSLGRYGLPPNNIPDEAYADLYRAINLRETDSKDSAIAIFNSLGESYPIWSRPLQEKALTYLNHHTFYHKTDILNSLLAAIDLDSSDPENYILLGTMFLHFRDWDEAEAALKLAYNMTSDDPRVFFYMSRLHRRRLKELPWLSRHAMNTHAINLAPGYEPARLALAQYYRVEWNRIKSVKLLDEGLEIDPESIPLLMAKAAHLVERKFSDQSIPICEKILELSPGHPDALYNLAISYIYLDELDTALVLLDSSYANGGPVDALYYKGVIYQRKHDYRKAISFFQERMIRFDKPDDLVSISARERIQMLKRWIAMEDSADNREED
ncbi:hypothetical protein HQ587_02215 [bacterium]|nr:hypothetical protein [bacterium]